MAVPLEQTWNSFEVALGIALEIDLGIVFLVGAGPDWCE